MHFLNRLRRVALGLAVVLTAAGSARSATNSFGFAGVASVKRNLNELSPDGPA
jgi:hypothetical protein